MLITEAQRTPRTFAWTSFILSIVSIPALFILPLAFCGFVLSIIFGLISVIMQWTNATRRTTKSMTLSFIGVGISAVFSLTLVYFGLYVFEVFQAMKAQR